MNITKILTIMCMVLISLNFVSAVTIKDVTSTPEEVAPGEVFDVSIEIENTHGFEIENINVRLILTEEKGEPNILTGMSETIGTDVPFAPYQSSTEKFLEDLGSEEDETFNFKLITLPSAASGIYKILVEINYEDEEGNGYSKDELISVIVNSVPELKVSVEESVLVRGEKNDFSIKIVNSGLADVKFAFVSVSDGSGVNFLCETEQYIGDIDSDDFDSMSCKVFIEETASGSITLPVVLRFKDATNKEFIQTKSVTLQTYTLDQARELGLVPKPSYRNYTVLGILVIGYVIYKIRKKRKLKKKLGGR